MRILVVEDDARVADFLERGLRAEGHQLQVARTGPDGLEAARALWQEVRATQQHAVVLLDLNLPGLGGLALCQTLRAEGCALPVLILSAMDTVEDRVTGLRLGADDYLTKPFAFEELLVRIEALARRSREWTPSSPMQLQVADLVLDRAAMRATRAGRPIHLTAKELALLELLMSAPGRLFSRERILANVWGMHQDPLTNVVDVYIRRLRAKVDEGFELPLIHTLRGLGYRLEAGAAP
ncbi:response regulator transcription factor [Azohydromonas caseinilytica]|uniref:Response regulator transcription factor n=1 Tax=Azohydromonas caseinilytica TaxID=2728836 RepID=A0A848FKW7_9BURK|nr:response regulator transcription factor [Azohydromonas caseinilytica]NML18910.1 response regulator transcription factor [Azohydromonas caseinilytica]